jgi:integrase
MWIEKQGNKFKARERYVDPLTGKTKTASVTIEKDTAQTRKAAQRALAEKIAVLQDAKQDNDITLKELSKLYLAHQKETVKASTYKTDASILPLVISAVGNDVLAGRLTARHIIKSIEKAQSQNMTRTVYRKYLRKMLRWAYRNDYVSNISFLDKIPSWTDDRESRIKDKYLSSQELTLLLNGMDTTRWRLLTQFLALTGLRIGEAIALLDSDVTDVIIVNKTADPRDGELSVSPKTTAGYREVYIQDELKPIIKAIRKEKLIDQMEKNYRSDRFFYAIKYDAFRWYLLSKSRKLLNHVISPHALRHTHVSLLAEQGMSLDAISRRVGHKDSRLTKQVYLHVTENQKQKDRDAVQGIRLLS